MKIRCLLLAFATAFSFLIARSEQTVGLVLSGGGAKGIAHVGVIKALEDNDIPIDYVAGTSLGSIVGSLYAIGWSPEKMYEFFTKPDFLYWADLLGVYLDFAFNSLVGELNRTLHSVGLPLNHAQFVILQKLFIKDGQSQSDIARSVGKDRAGISRSLNALEENGFIRRQAVSGSKNGIFLTEKAIENRGKITEAINIATTKAREGITDEEYELGIKFLKKIHSNL